MKRKKSKDLLINTALIIAILVVIYLGVNSSNKLKSPSEVYPVEQTKEVGYLIGRWTIKVEPLKKSYPFEIRKFEDGYRGIFPDYQNKLEHLRRTENTFYVVGSEHGEYYEINTKGQLEMFDRDGSLKPAGYHARKY